MLRRIVMLVILTVLMVSSGCSASSSQTIPRIGIPISLLTGGLISPPKGSQNSNISVRIGQRQSHGQVVQDEGFPMLRDYSHGQTVYDEDECIGPVIMGRCHGSILPKGGYRKKCYGEWLGGQCTGPMF